MEGVIGLAGVLAIVLAAGLVAGAIDRRNFAWRWLLAAAALVAINDALLTRLYGLLPDLLPGARNWEGKLLALAATLAIAALPAIGWRRSGITPAQRPGSARAVMPAALLYCAFFAALALAFPNDPLDREDLAFQLTLPGIEEECFYRGLLLLALDRAFAGRVRLLGVDWGWGALMSSMLFGLAHAFGYSDGAFAFDPVTMAATALPSLIAVWVRLRTGSVAVPVLLHNFGNTAMLLL